MFHTLAGAAGVAGVWFIRFTAFSLPGQFAPQSESANRTLANSLPGTFAPCPIRCLAQKARYRLYGPILVSCCMLACRNYAVHIEFRFWVLPDRRADKKLLLV